MAPSIASIRASNKAILSTLSTPTAVFLGGTSGIGRAMAESFAAHTNGAANIIILGRNESAGREIIASFPTSPGVVHQFVQCDATSMKGIGEVAEALRAEVPKVDFVVMSPGYSAIEGRTETEEGIDRKMAVNYYGRWKFIHDLLPAFNSESGTKVLSVLGAGYGKEIDPEDFALRKSYSVAKVAAVTPTYNDLMNEVLAFLPRHESRWLIRFDRASRHCTPSLPLSSPIQASCAPTTLTLRRQLSSAGRDRYSWLSPTHCR